jgi:hypothetical protein
MDRDTEIAQINHELEILRERRATYERSARRLRVFFLWLPIVFLPIVGTVFYQEPVTGLFIGGLTGVVCLVALLWYSLDHEQRRIVGPAFGIFTVYRTSDDRIIEEQIAEREQRLTELRAAN